MNTEPESGLKIRQACAKINLTLEVTGKRDDGYHEIASVMQAIDLCDTLTFQPAEHLYLDCNIAPLVSPSNLVFRAAKLLQNFAGGNKGAAISINKTIPLASGLGGGSSDAAATLQGLNELWDLNLSSEKLIEIGESLGSDTFFFLRGGGTALAEGRGDKITPLPSLSKTWVVLMKPPINTPNKTSSMYAGLNASDFTRGEATRKMIERLNSGDKIDTSSCYNVFERAAFSRINGLEEYCKVFLSAGAMEVQLAGSGPTLFTLVDSEGQGRDICERLRKERVEVYLAQTL